MMPPATQRALAEIFELLQRRGIEMLSAPDFDDELDPAAVSHLRGIGVRDPHPGEGKEAVCLPFDAEHPRLRFDNHIGRCGRCRRWVQFRPSLPRRLKRICPFCLLRALRGDA